MLRTTACAFALAASLGCDATLSSDLDSDELRLFASAEIDEQGRLDLVAQITTDNPALLEETFVDLFEGDTLIARLQGEEQVMTREWIPVLNIVQYRARYADLIGGEVLEIDLERLDHDDITGTSVRVPAAFELSMPTSFSRSDELIVDWTPVPASRSRLTMRGTCFDQSFDFDGNPGRVELAPPRLTVPEGTDAQAQCDVDTSVAVINERGAADGFGRGGRILAEQVRQATTATSP